ncbi:hypothetical protein ACWC09_25405 [Streptomyces sp. NPDC001617]
MEKFEAVEADLVESPASQDRRRARGDTTPRRPVGFPAPVTAHRASSSPDQSLSPPSIQQRAVSAPS